jgi:mannose-1-phosphate guanylyltransferase
MLQETALRVDEESLQRLIVVCSSEHRFAIAEQLHGIGLAAPRIILEPVGRNTAPAAAVAALAAAEEDTDALLLLMPADHLIADSQAFRRAVATGVAAAAEGHVVLFGIAPESPATGYGYIESGDPLAGHAGIDTVVRFHEKPDGATAKAYLNERPALVEFRYLPCRCACPAERDGNLCARGCALRPLGAGRSGPGPRLLSSGF